MRRQKLFLLGLLSPVTLYLGIFFFGPLAIIAVFSFLEPGLYGGVEWNFYHWNYGRMFGWADGITEWYEPIYLKILFRSMLMAVFTVIACLIVVYPVTFWVSRLPQRAQLFFMFLITLPFFTSLIIRLYAWLVILKPSGLINDVLLWVGVIDVPLDMLFTRFAVVLGMVYVMIPFMFLPVYSSVERLDPALIEASGDLGARGWQTFLKVILPQTLPGIAGGSVLVFIPSVGNFIIPDILGGAKGLMIGNLVEQQFLDARNWPFGAALSMVIMAVVLTVMLIYATKVVRAGQQVGDA